MLRHPHFGNPWLPRVDWIGGLRKSVLHARSVKGFWRVILIAIAMLLSARTGHAAMAPANSLIGNQASATYVDSTGVSRPATSNTVVTTVTQVKAFTLAASGFRGAPPNAQVCFPHTITNTGNGPDTYQLNAPLTGGAFAHSGAAYFPDTDFNGQPDSTNTITSSGLLAANASFGFVVCGTTPISATLGQQGTITVSVSDTNAPAPTLLGNVDTTTIQLASIAVSKKLSSVAPPGYTPVVAGPSPNAGPLYIVLEYSNFGNLQTDGLVLQDVLPSGMAYVPGTARWSGSGVAVLSDAPGGDPAGILYQAPTVAGSGTVQATVATVPGTTSGYLYFQVTIAGGLLPPPAPIAPTTNTAQFRYSYQFSGSTYCVNGSATSVIAAPNAAASCPSIGGDTNTVSYVVQQTAAVIANGSSTTTGLTDGEPVANPAAAPGQVVTWVDYIWNTGNGADVFDIDLRNTQLNGAACNPGNNAALGQCTFPANTTFRLLAAGGQNPLLDTNGNSTPDTGLIPLPTLGACPLPFVVSTSLPAKCGYPLVVTAMIPTATPTGNNGGNGFQVTVAATSSFNNAVSEVVTNRLATVSAATVDLTNNVSVSSGATPAQGLGPDDSTVKVTNSLAPSPATPSLTRFKLFTNNTSSIPQVYELSYAWLAVPGGVGLTTPPASWTVVFRSDGGAGDCSTTTGPPFTNTGAVPIPAGGSRLVCAEISVPPTSPGAGPATPTFAPPGNYVIQFTAAQQNDPLVADRIRDQITLLPTHAIAVTPNGAQNTVPGGAVSYSHVVTNSGNVTESVSFGAGTFLVNSQAPPFGWSASAYVDTNANGVLDILTDTPVVPGTTTLTVAPNSSQTLFVRVTAPPTVGSPPNVSSLTVTYNAGASTASATDTTTLTDGLKLEKFQQSPGGTGACTVAPTATITAGVPNAPWSGGPLASGANTAPGRCVAYLIIGTNNSTSSITNIAISDVTPPNTKLEAGCGLPTVTGPVGLSGGPYATGFSGVISATSAPLASTPLPQAGLFTLQFCVKINDL